jgi:hypothetical protein
MTRWTFLAAIVAWLIGSSVDGAGRTCHYRDYRGRIHDRIQPAAKLCPATIRVESL